MYFLYMLNFLCVYIYREYYIIIYYHNTFLIFLILGLYMKIMFIRKKKYIYIFGRFLE